MSLVQSMGRGIAWNTAGVFAGKAIGIINIMMILTHLSVYEYGLTELTMSVVASASVFLLPGMRSVVVADLGIERARGNLGRMKAIFLEYFLFNLALGAVMWVVFFFGSTIVAELTGNMLIDQFFKIVAFLFLTSPFISATTALATVSIRYFDQSF
ncbi:MAG TPA: oligosaccharide flippase family protein [Pyrinomonadaceae bacterium]|nr:oligosaccharide flippase family protein [Pyrinomonadaceae bacterium]